MGSNRGIWLDWDTVWFFYVPKHWLIEITPFRWPKWNMKSCEITVVVAFNTWLFRGKGWIVGKQRLPLLGEEKSATSQLRKRLENPAVSKKFGPWHAPTSCPNQKAGAFRIKRYRSSSTWSSSAMLNVMTSTGVEITRLIGDLHLLMVISSGWGYTYPSEKWWSSSVGIMTFPTEWKNKIHVPNHQPVMVYHYIYRQ